MTRVPLKELPEFVRNVRATLATDRRNTCAVILALKGNLGAGKTTFVQQLAQQMGVSEVVQSPTYVLMKTYKLPGGLSQMGQPQRFKKLVHIDAYRLNSAAEFAALKPEEFLNDQSALVVVEWPEKVEGALPKPDLTLKFSAEDAGEGERYIEVA